MNDHAPTRGASGRGVERGGRAGLVPARPYLLMLTVTVALALRPRLSFTLSVST